MASACLIEKVPDELILQILGCLDLVLDRESCRHLALVSRRFNKIVTPILYETFTQTGDEGTALTLLLKRVLENPEAGTTFKVYTAHDLHIIRWPDNPFEDRIQGLIRQALVPYSPTNFFADVWFERIMIGDWDALTALLIARLLNLEKIDLQHMFNEDEEEPPSEFAYLRNIFILAAVPHMNRDIQTRPLQQLSALGLKLHLWEPDSLLCFLRVPSLKNLVLDHFVCESLSSVLALVEADPVSRIQDLEVEANCWIEPQCMVQFLAIFKCLKHLNFTNLTYDAGLFGKAIINLQPTLEELALEVAGFTPMDWAQTQHGITPTALASLSEFQVLRSITIEYELFFGPSHSKDISQAILDNSDIPSLFTSLAGMLPESLERIRLLKCGYGSFDKVSEFARSKDIFPHLKTMELQYRNWMAPGTPIRYHGYQGKAAADRLVRECDIAGFALYIKLYSCTNYESSFEGQPPPSYMDEGDLDPDMLEMGLVTGQAFELPEPSATGLAHELPPGSALLYCISSRRYLIIHPNCDVHCHRKFGMKSFITKGEE